MNYTLTYQELDAIIGRARVAFKEDVRHYGDERDEQLMHLCENLQFSATYDTNAMFFTLKDYEND